MTILNQIQNLPYHKSYYHNIYIYIYIYVEREKKRNKARFRLLHMLFIMLNGKTTPLKVEKLIIVQQEYVT